MLCIVVESAFVGFVPGLCTCILRDCVTEDRVFDFMFNEAESKIRWHGIKNTWEGALLWPKTVSHNVTCLRWMYFAEIHCLYISTPFHHWCRGRMCGTQGSLWGCSTSRGWGVMQNGRRWDYVTGASVCGCYVFSVVWWISGIVVVFGDNWTVNVGNRSVQTSYNTLYIHSTVTAVLAVHTSSLYWMYILPLLCIFDPRLCRYLWRCSLPRSSLHPISCHQELFTSPQWPFLWVCSVLIYVQTFVHLWWIP